MPESGDPSRHVIDVIVRPAGVGDVAPVRVMEEAWEAEGISRGFQATDTGLISVYVGGCFFVAEHGGVPVGFVRGRVRDDERNSSVVPAGERYLEIEDLYVTPDQRSHGAGAALVDAACEWAKSRGVRFATLYSSTVDVERVMRFYQASGFQAWAVQMFRRLD